MVSHVSSLFLSVSLWCVHGYTRGRVLASMATTLCLVIWRAKGDRVEGRGRCRWNVKLLFNFNLPWIFDRSTKKKGREFFEALRRGGVQGSTRGAGFTRSRTSLILLFIEPARWRFPRQKGNCKLVPVVRNILVRIHRWKFAGWLLFMNLIRLIGGNFNVSSFLSFFLFRSKIFLEKSIPRGDFVLTRNGILYFDRD